MSDPRKEITRHKQVPFITLNGHSVEVDEGLFETLTELKRLGIYTQFSCQGDKVFGAYILMDTKSAHRLFKKIKDMEAWGWYSNDHAQTIRKFRQGYRLFEFNIFTSNGNGHRRLFGLKFSRGVNKDQGFAVERDYSKLKGDRFTVRWPTKEIPKVLALLKVTY